MEYFLQQLINGVTLGSIYGLIAIGYTMVYGIIGMINFAHGDVFMVGAFIALIAFLMLVALGVTAVPLALAVVLIVAIALTALYGCTVQLSHFRCLRAARRCGRHHVPALLLRDRLLHRLRRRRESVHRGGPRRHRIVAGRHAGRAGDLPDRDLLVRLFFHRIQGRGSV